MPMFCRLAALGFALAAAAPAFSQGTGDAFADGPANAKVHVASGFLCPAKIGLFERDAVGERDPGANADFCAYSALEGVYGTITLVPLKGPYDPKTALVPDFVEQEGIGGRVIGEGTARFGGASVYSRAYETTSLEDLHYRTLFAASAVGNWAVQVTMEYATPRDDAVEQEFMNAVYAGALKTLAAK
jgi:hypothetical protein